MKASDHHFRANFSSEVFRWRGSWRV